MVHTYWPKGFPYSYLEAQVYTIQLHGPCGQGYEYCHVIATVVLFWVSL